MMKKDQSIMIYSYFLDFISHICAAIALVLSADSLQNKINNFHMKYNCTYDSPAVKISAGKVVRSYGYPKFLVLTGWGMFIVRKPLLLSMSAWLFTYAVIIIQFYYTPT
ncbi:hypothetical protein AVEN_11746-1 [Araneus ventricosus]|uniref:Uncharacterized protein n=1 Tax=Araneus ventricosus TaxID=182803 RepID=A0A4Y2EUJ2_ARAVE|nr:hypothetical protein AVEN_11746-1 [Araneus ventricosus]